MAYAMLSEDGTAIIGPIYARPQPGVSGLSFLEDDDPRVIVALDRGVWELRPLLIIERLEAYPDPLGQGRDMSLVALTALKQDTKAYERWVAARTISSSDAQVRGLFNSLGIDPDAILAREV